MNKQELLLLRRRASGMDTATIIQLEQRNSETDLALGMATKTPGIDIRRLIEATPCPSEGVKEKEEST